MSIAGAYTPSEYTGNGATTAFAFTFPFFANTDLMIVLYDTVANQLVSPQPVLNGGATYDYTVTSAPNADTGESAGGTITFNHAPPANYRIDIFRQTAVTQPNVFTSNAKMPAKTIESSLDRVVMQNQEDALLSQLRALTVPNGDPLSTNIVLPGFYQRALKGLFFDANGNPVVGNYTQSQIEAAVAVIIAAGATPTSLPSYTQAGLPGSGIVNPSLAFCSDLAGDPGGELRWDGTVWRRTSEKGYALDAATLTGTVNLGMLSNAVTIRYTGSLTGNVIVNAPTTGLYQGARRRIVFAGTLNAHTFTFSYSGNNKSLAVNQFIEIEYDTGAAAWVEVAGGTLL